MSLFKLGDRVTFHPVMDHGTMGPRTEQEHAHWRAYLRAHEAQPATVTEEAPWPGGYLRIVLDEPLAEYMEGPGPVLEKELRPHEPEQLELDLGIPAANTRGNDV